MNQCIWKLLLVCITGLFCSWNPCFAQPRIDMIKNGQSLYNIVLSAEPTKAEQKAAEILQTYLYKVSGTRLAIVGEGPGTTAGIYIGNTERFSAPKKLKDESFIIKTDQKDIIICGRNGGGVLYGIYAFLEKYAGCTKPDAMPVSFTRKTSISIPAHIDEVSQPDFLYREAYYPMSINTEYLQWHRLHLFEDLWGLWGHSFNKLLPSSRYFKEHPEYYSYINGQRQPIQLCLSNDEVFKIVVKELKTLIAKRPDVMYWSIAPNDQNGYCQCRQCKTTDEAEGGPSGSLVRFVNRIAAVFPEQKFTTLAYGYTIKPPAKTKPLPNVYIFLSNIDAYKDQPLTKEPSAQAFVRYLKQWSAITQNIFIWDYATQFTNYMAPFPNLHTVQENFRLYKAHNVKGIFEQGSGNTYSDFAELRSYIYGKLLWDADANVTNETIRFINEYYGPAARHVRDYYDLLTSEMLKSKRKLDIYGNPVNDWNSYLTPTLIEVYYKLLDKAAKSVANQHIYSERIQRLRLSIDYTVLQQSRMYGIENHGMYTLDGDRYTVRTGWPERVAEFVANAKKAGVTELAEGGMNPDEYKQEWAKIFDAQQVKSKALNATVTFEHPYSAEYPAKGTRAIVDGATGFADYSYNWLLFYSTPLVAQVTLPVEENISEISIGFLHDPRHWILSPDRIEIAISSDGNKYETVAADSVSIQLGQGINRVVFRSKFPAVSIKYLKVQASLKGYSLPDSPRKLSIAADEVFVN